MSLCVSVPGVRTFRPIRQTINSNFLTELRSQMRAHDHTYGVIARTAAKKCCHHNPCCIPYSKHYRIRYALVIFQIPFVRRTLAGGTLVLTRSYTHIIRTHSHISESLCIAATYLQFHQAIPHLPTKSNATSYL